MSAPAQNRRERLVVGAGIVVVAVALWLGFAPAGSAPGQLPAGDAMRQASATSGEAAGIKDQARRLAPRLDAMLYAGSPEAVMPAVVEDLQRQATACGLHVRELKPLRPKMVGGLARQSVTVRFSSEFPKLIPYLYRLEEDGGKLVVDKMNIATADAKARVVDVELQVAFFTRGLEPVGDRPERRQ